MAGLWEETVNHQQNENWSNIFANRPHSQSEKISSNNKKTLRSKVTIEQCICKMILLTEQLLDSRLNNLENLVENNRTGIKSVRKQLVQTQRKVFGGGVMEKENLGQPLFVVNTRNSKLHRVTTVQPVEHHLQKQPIVTVDQQAYRPIQVNVPVRNSDRSVVNLEHLKRGGSRNLSRISSVSQIENEFGKGEELYLPASKLQQRSVHRIQSVESTSNHRKDSAASDKTESSKAGAGISSVYTFEGGQGISHGTFGLPSPQTVTLMQDNIPLSETIASSSQDTPPMRLPMHESIESFRAKQIQRKRQLQMLESLPSEGLIKGFGLLNSLDMILNESNPPKPLVETQGSMQQIGASIDDRSPLENEEIKFEECRLAATEHPQEEEEDFQDNSRGRSFPQTALGFVVPEVNVGSVTQESSISHKRSQVRQQSRGRTLSNMANRDSKTREKVIGPKICHNHGPATVSSKLKPPHTSLTAAAEAGSRKYYDQLLRELESKDKPKSRSKTPKQTVLKEKEKAKVRVNAMTQVNEIPEWPKKKEQEGSRTKTLSVTQPQSQRSSEGERTSSEEYHLVGAVPSQETKSPAPKTVHRPSPSHANQQPSTHQFEEFPSAGWKKKLAFEENTVTSKNMSAARTEQEVELLVQDYLKNTSLQNFPNTALKGLIGDATSAKGRSQTELSDRVDRHEFSAAHPKNALPQKQETAFNSELESARYAHKILNKFSNKELSLKGLFHNLEHPLSSDN